MDFFFNTFFKSEIKLYFNDNLQLSLLLDDTLEDIEYKHTCGIGSDWYEDSVIGFL